MRKEIALMACLLLTACATPKELTREEQIALQERTYPQHDSEEVIQAAQQVLQLADPSDTSFSHHKDGFRAERGWFAYFVIGAAMGTWYWQFESLPLDSGGTRVTLVLAGESSSITGTSTGAAGGTQATTFPSAEKRVTYPAPYELFWARVDYLLDERTEWAYCEEWERRLLRNETWHSIEPLCGPGSEDLAPDNAPNERPEPLNRHGPPGSEGATFE